MRQLLGQGRPTLLLQRQFLLLLQLLLLLLLLLACQCGLPLQLLSPLVLALDLLLHVLLCEGSLLLRLVLVHGPGLVLRLTGRCEEVGRRGRRVRACARLGAPRVCVTHTPRPAAVRSRQLRAVAVGLMVVMMMVLLLMAGVCCQVWWRWTSMYRHLAGHNDTGMTTSVAATVTNNNTGASRATANLLRVVL